MAARTPADSTVRAVVIATPGTKDNLTFQGVVQMSLHVGNGFLASGHDSSLSKG